MSTLASEVETLRTDGSMGGTRLVLEHRPHDEWPWQIVVWADGDFLTRERYPALPLAEEQYEIWRMEVNWSDDE